jgi:DNA-binding XRE family transcriptional regulator
MSKKKAKGTIEKYLEAMSSPKRKNFDEEYRELLISEMLIAAMQKDDISVRELAKKAGVSPTTIQGIRKGTNDAPLVLSLPFLKA